MSDRWFESEGEEEWAVVEDKKRISRAVRRERKAAEASLSAAVGAAYEEFDADAARQAAQIGFYGQQKQKKKDDGRGGRLPQRRGAPIDEEAGWTGDASNGKPKKKKVKTVVSTYSTAEELAEALYDIVSRVPPTQTGASTTLASLGDKLQTLTKATWNKRYKSEFGTMRAFLQARPNLFVVDGDEVRLATPGTAANTATDAKQGKKAKKSQKATSAAGASKGTAAARAESESDSEEDDESDSEEDTPPATKRTATKKQAKTGGSSVGTVLALLIAAAAGGYFYYTRVLTQKQ